MGWNGAKTLRSRDILVSKKRAAPNSTPLPKAAAAGAGLGWAGSSAALGLWGSLCLEWGAESFSLSGASLSNVPG